jgi:hypothetical protein
LSLGLGMVEGQYGGLGPVLYGTLHLLCGSSAEDVLQLLIHLGHPVGRGCGQRIHEHGPSEGGKLQLLMVGHHGPLCPEHGLALV